MGGLFMGKIFGISDLPVSTIESALKGMYHVDPPPAAKLPRVKPVQNQTIVDLPKIDKKSNAFVKMRNGFGKLMSHFSKSKK